MAQTILTGKKTTLSKVLNPTDVVMDVASAPTITKGRGYLFNGSQEEWFSYNGIIGNQLQSVVRGLSQTAIPATAGNGLKWIAGTRVKFVIMHDQLVDRREDIDFEGAISFSKSMKYPVYANAAARDVAIPSPSNGMVVYNTSVGLPQKFQAGSWVDDTAGGAVANGSETVAGKFQQSTDAAFVAGTDLGSTGAQNVPKNSQVKAAITTAVSNNKGISYQISQNNFNL